MDLSTLKNALAPLAEVGKDERTFTVEGQSITVRPLLPHEEVSVQRFAVSSLEEINDGPKKKKGGEEEDAMSRADALDYFDRFRIEVVAHSMVQINDINLRDVEHITTGEVTATGVEVRVPRYEAMRKIIRDSWSRTMVTTAFTQYGELIESMAQKADELAQLSEMDLEVEIERVADRLAQLKKQRAERSAGNVGISKEQVEHFVGMGQRQEEQTQNLVEHHKNTTPIQKVPAVVESPPQQEVPAAPVREAPVSFDTARSSFQDADDPDVLAAEQRRILEARRLAQSRERDRLEQGSVPTKAPSVDGVETYRMPTEELSPRGKQAPVKGKTELDPTSRGELNPNFGRK